MHFQDVIRRFFLQEISPCICGTAQAVAHTSSFVWISMSSSLIWRNKTTKFCPSNTLLSLYSSATTKTLGQSKGWMRTSKPEFIPKKSKYIFHHHRLMRLANNRPDSQSHKASAVLTNLPQLHLLKNQAALVLSKGTLNPFSLRQMSGWCFMQLPRKLRELLRGIWTVLSQRLSYKLFYSMVINMKTPSANFSKDLCDLSRTNEGFIQTSHTWNSPRNRSNVLEHWKKNLVLNVSLKTVIIFPIVLVTLIECLAEIKFITS